jgi:hypothetical protein
MESGLIIVLFIAFTAIIIVVALLFNKKAIIKRRLRKFPVVPLNEFKDGDYGRICGKVVLAEEGLIAPLSGRKCAYYYVHVEQKVSSGKSSHWDTIIEEERSGNFVVQQGSHCALINAEKLKSYIVQDRNFSSGTFHDADANLESYLNRNGKKSTGIFGLNKTLRYREGVLEPGEMIAVAGYASWKYTERTDIPAPYGKVLVFSSENGKAVYLSDDPDTVISD